MVKPLKQTIGTVVVRVYAFTILAVVVWAGYTAASYLYRSVFQPAKSPPAMLNWQAETAKSALREAEAPGVTEPALRSAIGHYHGVDRWFQPDVRNGCITSGCHDPIPHSHSKALRAFANLHATFMTCEVCHAAPSAVPMPAVWISMKTGQRQDPPAILQLLSHLAANPTAGEAQMTESGAAAPVATRGAEQSPSTTMPAVDLAEFSRTTVRLLRESIDVIGGDPVLNYLLLQIDSSEPGSPIWRRAVSQLRSEVPNHARGEYGAKIAVTAPSPDQQPIRQDFGPLVEEYFSRATDQAQRGEIVQKIHQGVNPAPGACTPCHRGQPPLLDFAALGYPRQRINELTSTPIIGMMQQIRQGQPFALPLAP